MHILIIIFFVIFIYGAFSTIFHSAETVGQIGKVYGDTNINLFGYLAYIDLLILLYPLYQLYTDRRLLKDIGFYLGWIMLFISLILLQSLVVDRYSCGTIGLALYQFLYTYIGKAGLWLTWLLTIVIGFILILDEIPDIDAILKRANRYKKDIWRRAYIFISDMDNPFFDKKSTDKMTTIVAQRKVRKKTAPPPIVERTVKRAKKVVHKKRKLPDTEDEMVMLEERPIDDIAKIKIIHQEPLLRKEVKEIKSKSKPKKRLKKEKKVDIELEPPSIGSSINIREELEQNRQLMDNIEKGKIDEPDDFVLPYIEFLAEAPSKTIKIDEAEIDRKVHELLNKLSQFKISGEVMDIYSGPLVTTFEFKPAPNVKVSKILNLQDDLAMALQAETIRIQAPIPGRNVIGIEIPNDRFDTIYLRDILESEIFTTSKSPLTIAMGKDIVGNAFVTDLKRLPHLLIAGTTGSGKSVGINAMILSLLYRNDPDSLKLMLIDPKMLEFSIYNDIPHLSHHI